MSPADAQRELGLSAEEFETALQAGELWTVQVPGEPGRPPRTEVSGASLRRLMSEEYPVGLKERLRLVGAVTGAELLGITRDRFTRLAKAGCFRPARWYINRYRAVVWLYPVYEVLAYALDNPDWLTGRLPRTVREGLADGLDKRAAGWRMRRTGLLARHAPDQWHEAAAWFALLGEEQAADLVPDESVARRLRASVPPPPVPRTGWRRPATDPSPVSLIADDAIEVAHARLRMTIAIERAQKPPAPVTSAGKRTALPSGEPDRGRPAPSARRPAPTAEKPPNVLRAVDEDRSECLPTPPLPPQPWTAEAQPPTAVPTSCGGGTGTRARESGRPVDTRRERSGRVRSGDVRSVPDGRARPAGRGSRAGEPAGPGRRLIGILRRARRPVLLRGRQ